jgi:hypothetical protein
MCQCQYCQELGVGGSCYIDGVENKMEEVYKESLRDYGVEEGKIEFKMKMIYWYNGAIIKNVMRKFDMGISTVNKVACVCRIWNYYMNKFNPELLDMLPWTIDRRGGNSGVIEYLLYTEQYKARLNNKKIGVKIDNNNNKNRMLDCAICYEGYSEEKCVSLNCTHEFCSMCVQSILKLSSEPSCALCRNSITEMSVKSEEIYIELNKLI